MSSPISTHCLNLIGDCIGEREEGEEQRNLREQRIPRVQGEKNNSTCMKNYRERS